MPEVKIKICSKCKTKLPATIEYFYRKKGGKCGVYSICKRCVAKYDRQKYLENREEMLERSRRYNRNNREKRRGHTQQRRLKSKFNITIEQYNQMLGVQNNVCAICGELETIVSRGKVIALAVDHNHKTGDIRQLLCGRCNVILGRVGEDKELLLKLALYLEKWSDNG